MFLENNKITKTAGSIEVITGSMFSGKTEELIRRLKRAQIAKQKVNVFKPEIDNRYSNKDIVSHNRTAIKCTLVQSAKEIPLLVKNADVIGIDEAQFFDNLLITVCTTLANKGVRVLVAGLDMDFKGRPFGPMPALMAVAEYITKVHAVCVRCGNLAQFSHRVVPGNNLVMLGETNDYEPLCRECYHNL